MTDRAGEEPDEVSSIGRASAVLAAGTLVSRVLGFVSAFVLSIAVGTVGAGIDSFRLANQLPNSIYAIVAGGLLGAILVPQVVRARVHDDGGQRFVNKVVTLGVLLLLAITVVVTLCAPALVRLYAQGGGGEGFTEAQFALATSFAYWCLPQVLFYGLYSLVGEILNARGVFGPFTWAPAVNNVVAIGGMLVFIALFGGPVGARGCDELELVRGRPARRVGHARDRRAGIRAPAVLEAGRTAVPSRLRLARRRARPHRRGGRLALRDDPADSGRGNRRIAGGVAGHR